MNAQISTATRLDELLDPDELQHAINIGHVRAQTSPDGRFGILNYTEVVQFSGAWTPVTLACRGLIYDLRTLEVVARPYAKFFNYGQPGAPNLDLQQVVEVVDKIDGSLGILYDANPFEYAPLAYAIATRGSFTSDQAVHATQVYRGRYAETFMPPAGWTVLFEIVYPGNRIVCDYGDRDDLVLLGAVHIATGEVVGPHADQLAGWPGPRAQTFGTMSAAEALFLPPRAGAEGIVLRAVDGTMVKVKEAEYVRLHRIVTGLNVRVVWEWLRAGTLPEMVAQLPDEFHAWAVDMSQRLLNKFTDLHDLVTIAYTFACHRVFDGPRPDEISREQRKAFALDIKQHITHDLQGFAFALLDGRDIRTGIWDMLRPEAGPGVFGRSPEESQ